MAKKAPQNAHQSTHVVYQKRKSHRHQRIKLRKNRTQGKWKRYSSCTKYNISVVVYAVTELKSNKNDSSMCHRWEWEKKSEKSKAKQRNTTNFIEYNKIYKNKESEGCKKSTEWNRESEKEREEMKNPNFYARNRHGLWSKRALSFNWCGCCSRRM